MFEKKPLDYRYFSVNDFLLDDYFQQWVQSPDEGSDRFWQAFLHQYPQQEETLTEAREILTALQFKPYVLSDAQKQKYLEAIYRAADPLQKKQLPLAPVTRPFPRTFIILKKYRGMVAAISAIVIVAALIYLYIDQQEFSVYVTTYGETKTLTLVDGTVVKLNANSRLIVNIDMQKDQPREVSLMGEAYFEVAEVEGDADAMKNKKRFIVHTDELEVEVLGTAFNVNTREEKTQVVLNKGSVKVSGKHLNSSVVMQPGEMLELSKKDQTFRRNQVNPQNYTSWKDQMFIFDNTPLRQVANEIEAYYGVKVLFEDQELENKVFSVSAVPREELDMLLSLIEEAFKSEKIEAIKENNLVTIRYQQKQISK